tara:strand:+ start:66 stop:860 length:795 start_codon:yes stop_codon:yes gene_type:complete
MKKNIFSEFKKNGYAIIPNFISKNKINKIFSELHQVINVCLEGSKLNKYKKLKNIDKKYILLLSKNPSLKSHFYDMIKFTEEVNKLMVSNKFLNISKKLLNEKNVFVNNRQIRIDHKKDSYYLPQHQELGQLSTNLITFWIPLVDLKDNIGGIYLRPKTHKLGFLPYKNFSYEARKAGIERKEIIEKLFNKPHLKKFKNIYPKLNSGDAVIFHNYLFHGTMPNINNKKIRWVFIARYNSIKKTPYLKNKNAKMMIPYTADYSKL